MYAIIKNNFSYLDTLINMLKGNIGCGILAMGDAFKNGGLLLSLILTLFIAIISVYNQHLLVRYFSKRLNLEIVLKVIIWPYLLLLIAKMF